jgi:hypothetical protein
LLKYFLVSLQILEASLILLTLPKDLIAKAMCIATITSMSTADKSKKLTLLNQFNDYKG